MRVAIAVLGALAIACRALVLGTVADSSYDSAVKQVTHRLFAYFWGANAESLRMKETVPLLVTVELSPVDGVGADGDAPPAPLRPLRNHTVAMYLPWEHQDAPPTPTDPGLFVFRSPRGKLFVRTFRRAAREARVVEHADALMDALDHAGHHEYEAAVAMVRLTFARLRWLNLGVGAFQLLTSAAIFSIGPYDSWAKLPWYSFFVASWSRDDGAAQEFYRRARALHLPAPKQVADFPISVWSAVFLLLSGLDHVIVVLPGINKVYNRRAGARLLCQNKNPFRWAEYSISASLMSVMIAQLCGVTDVHLLFTLAALMATTMLFGWQMEVSNGAALPTFVYAEDAKAAPRPRPASPDGGALPLAAAAGAPAASPAPAAPRRPVDWAPFAFGCWPFLAVQAVTACYFFQAVSNGDPPAFVWSIFWILLVLYVLFAVNQALQFKQASGLHRSAGEGGWSGLASHKLGTVRGWRGFALAEFYYILLSLTAKQLLAWVTYGGVRRFEP
eukprot:scaffold2.g6951.t1